MEKDYRRNGREENGKYGKKRDESSNRKKKNLNCVFKSVPNGINLLQILADSTCQKCCRWLGSAAGMAWKGNGSCGCLNRLFTAKIPTVPSHCHETVLVPLFETSIWAFQMADLCVAETRRVLDSLIPVSEE